MSARIQKAIDESVKVFVENIANKYNLESKELMELWKSFDQKRVRAPSQNKGKVTGFILYSKNTRDTIKAENEGISFGDTSKMLGKRWKALEDSEREEWNVKAKVANGVVEPEAEAEVEADPAPKKQRGRPAKAADDDGGDGDGGDGGGGDGCGGDEKPKAKATKAKPKGKRQLKRITSSDNEDDD